MNKVNVEFCDWKRLDYQKAWDQQEQIFNNQLDCKKYNKPTSDTLIFVEHPHVYTLGHSGDMHNLLVSTDFLDRIGATYYKVNRGGDITYHGPGQIVGYPILDLEHFAIHLKEYIYQLEEVIIRTLEVEYGITAHRLDGATGVWLGEDQSLRKICAIGTKASRYITMHGFAFNINTDLKYFDYINPCGFTDKGVTSVAQELGKQVDFEEAKKKLLKHFCEIFQAEISMQ